MTKANRTRHARLTLLAALTLAGSVHAQAPVADNARLAVGQRIRVHLSDDSWVTGRVLGLPGRPPLISSS